MNKKYTLSEAVKEFGNDMQKEALIKNKGNLKKNSFDALYKTILQHYQNVIVEGRGKKRIFICSLKYQHSINRTDNRKYNGRNVPYDGQLIKLLINFLNKQSKDRTSLPMSTWLVSLGLINYDFLNSNRYSLPRKEHIATIAKNFEKHNNLNEELIEHFTNQEMSRLKRNLENLFIQLDASRVIEFNKEIWGKAIEDQSNRKLDQIEFLQLQKIENNLLEKHRLTRKDLFNKHSDLVSIYKKELSNTLKQELGLQYIYSSYNIRLLKTANPYENDYKHLLDEFKELNTNYSLQLASMRQRRINKSDHWDIVDLKKSGNYLIKWELLLIHYGFTLYDKPHYDEIYNRIDIDSSDLHFNDPNEFENDEDDVFVSDIEDEDPFK